MGGVLTMAQAIAELIAQRQENLFIGILIIVLVTTPVADRYFIRRRRIDYRVLYNSKIGLNPVALRDDASGSSDPADPKDPRGRLSLYADMLDRMSIVIVRVRNTGGYDIEPGDFGTAMSFTFGKRVIWDARISDASNDELRKNIRDRMEFFSQAPGDGEQADDNKGVRAVRRRLGDRLRPILLGPPPSGPDKAAAPEWHGVRLPELALRRREKFKLVVVLHEPGAPGSQADKRKITKDFDVRGAIHSGVVKNEKDRRRISWPRAAFALGALLAVVLVFNVVGTSLGSSPEPAVRCASGHLRLEGSSAFSEPLGFITGEYAKACHSAAIDLQLTGSRAGMHDLIDQGSPASDGLAVLNDGPNTTLPSAGLRSHPVAVIVYGAIVSDSTGITDLRGDQIRDIFSGRFHWWDQLGGRHVPIRTVGRDGESGTRQILQDKLLLGRSEGAASSTECAEQSPPRHAATIRCELRTTGEVIDKVATTPGAIGYADAPTAKTEAARRQTFHVVTLGGRLPEATSIAQGYPFWTVEYLYTAGDPAAGSLLSHFIDYLGGASARAELSVRGYPPCIDRDGDRNPLCAIPP